MLSGAVPLVIALCVMADERPVLMPVPAYVRQMVDNEVRAELDERAAVTRLRLTAYKRAVTLDHGFTMIDPVSDPAILDEMSQVLAIAREEEAKKKNANV